MNKKVYLSPSDQVHNTYAWGNTTEAVQCRRIAEHCRKALERCGVDVKCNTMDEMEERVAESNRWGADLHVCIHTNAFNGKVTGTRIFYYSETSPGKKCAADIFKYLAPITPGKSENMKTYPGLYEMRKTNAICVYCECEFHDNAEAARWIVEHVNEIGEAIAHGICDYLGVAWKEPSAGVIYRIQVGAFSNRDYAEQFLKTVREDYPEAFIVAQHL